MLPLAAQKMQLLFKVALSFSTALKLFRQAQERFLIAKKWSDFNCIFRQSTYIFFRFLYFVKLHQFLSQTFGNAIKYKK